MNRENLRILADYLDALPVDTKKFDMRTFATHRSEPYRVIAPFVAVEAYEECGTVACAVGHAPLAGIPAWFGENWVQYEERVFGLTNAEFDWCFVGAWCNIDNTPQGAAARIRWMLDSGVPYNYTDQINGKTPLCYTVSA